MADTTSQAEAPEDAEVAEIEKRHLYDETHPWRATDHKALAAHNDRATLLAKLRARTSQAEAQAPTTAALTEWRCTFPLDDAQVVMKDYDVGTPEYRCAEFVWVNRPATVGAPAPAPTPAFKNVKFGEVEYEGDTP